MSAEIYKFMDYKDFLLSLLGDSPARGAKKSWAEACGCQRSYLSKVLQGPFHFSAEQAHALGEYLGLARPELGYFLDLVVYARAAAPRLRDHIQTRLDLARKSQSDLSSRFNEKRVVRVEHQMVYYGNWLLSAIHILTDCPGTRTVESLAQRLQIPRALVQSTLIQLSELGLIKYEDGEWRIGTGSIHLPKQAQMQITHHSQWHSRAMLDCAQVEGDGLHYTVVQSHSADTFATLKAAWIKQIESMKKEVTKSPPEDAYCFKLNLFRI